MTIFIKGVALKRGRKMVATEEAGHIGGSNSYTTLQTMLKILVLIQSAMANQKTLLSKGETWSDLPFKAHSGCLMEGRLEWDKEGKGMKNQLQQYKEERMVAWTRVGFLNLDAIDKLSQIILCWGDCPVHCRTLSSISLLYIVDARNITPSNCDNLKYYQAFLHVPLGTKLPRVRTLRLG